jgi:hypothetical protein
MGLSWGSGPKTWAFEEELGSSEMNTEVRDRYNYLYKPRAARVYRSTTQSINNITWTALTHDNERWDPDGMFTASSSNINIPSAALGIFMVGGFVSFAANSTGVRGVRILVDGTTVIAQDVRPTPASPDTCEITINCPWRWTVAGSVRLDVYQSSGGSLNVNVNAELWAIWLGNP